MIIAGFQTSATMDGRSQDDGSVALYINDKIYSLPQAYLSQKKHDGSVDLALYQILDHFGLELLDVDQFVVSTCGEIPPCVDAPVHLRTDSKLSLQDLGVLDEKITWVKSHHLSHAYEGLLSLAAIIDWEQIKAGTWAIFVADRIGQPGEFQTLFRVNGCQIEKVWQDIICASPFNGFCESYDLLTKFLGFERFDAGKVMAIAANKNSDKVTERLFSVEGNTVSLQNQFRGFGVTEIFNVIKSNGRRLGFSTEDFEYLATCLQKSIEDAVSQLVSINFGGNIDGIVVSGGIGQNCHLISALRKHLNIMSMGSICPGDIGQGIGNIVQFLFESDSTKHDAVLPQISFIRKIPKLARNRYSNNLVTVEQAAAIINDGGIIISIGENIEPGPRALGFHSIFADARNPTNREIVSEIIKEREAFRPLGAIVSDRILPSCVLEKQPSVFMDSVFYPDEQFRTEYPAIVHDDGSTRFQRIYPVLANTTISEIMEILAKEYNIYAIINTSLNISGKPLDITGIEEKYDNNIYSKISYLVQ